MPPYLLSYRKKTQYNSFPPINGKLCDWAIPEHPKPPSLLSEEGKADVNNNKPFNFLLQYGITISVTTNSREAIIQQRN